jgi:hypothetical protein
MTTAPTTAADPLEDTFATTPEATEVPQVKVERFRCYLDDGEVLEVTCDHRDLRAYTILRDRLKLPTIGADLMDGAFLAAFQAWHAARYRHHVTERSWADWNAHLMQLDLIAREAIPPTGPGSGDT